MNRVSRTPQRKPARLGPVLVRLVCVLAFGLSGLAQAQQQRLYPAGSLQGWATFGAWPEVTINCTPYRLGPGIRVLDPEQHVLLTGKLPGLQARVVFQRDAMGQIFRIWLVGAQNGALATVPVAPSNCLFGSS